MGALLRIDHALARAMNDMVSARPEIRGAIAVGAQRLRDVEIGLMILLALRGRVNTTLRVLASVGVVYACCAVIGLALARPRPFVRHESVRELAQHPPHRSFPSRHVASAFAMAAVAGGASGAVSRSMFATGLLLAVARVAAGLHYPSDVLGGGLLGLAVGRLLRRPL